MSWILFGGSLLAVLATAGIVAWLGLGRDARIAEADAARLAEDLLVDFEAEEAFLDADARSALVRGADGSFALLRLHGAHPVARRLTAPLAIRREGERFWIDAGERRFGPTAIRNDKLLTLL
jgi:hypothetical protein